MERLCPEGRDWLHCTLCRSGRESVSTLQKAHTRKVSWPEPNTRLAAPIEEPVVYTSFEDAFSSMMHLMTTSTRKCGRYHNSHKPHVRGSLADKHCLKYHSPRPAESAISNPLPRTPAVHVNTAPGTYSITAANWTTNSRKTTHVVRVEPGQSISLTLDI